LSRGVFEMSCLVERGEMKREDRVEKSELEAARKQRGNMYMLYMRGICAMNAFWHGVRPRE
jgi:hypothetical protein